MKIRCSNCKAVISVADEKLAGKTGRVKIRCPECQTVLGIQLAAEVPPVAEEPEWYYAIGDEQAGPVTRTQLVAEMTAGAVSAESLVWKPGMDDWAAAGTLDELAEIPEPTMEIPQSDVEPPSQEPLEMEEPADEEPQPEPVADEDPQPEPDQDDEPRH